MREPYVFPLDESPFSPDVPPLERRRRVLEVGADVVTDEAGLVVDFMSEADVEGVLSDPRFAAVALPTLQLSGVESGPLWDLWSHLMFAKDSEEHKRIRGVVNREFTPKRIERLRPDCTRLANALCDAIPVGEPFDFWSAFAVPYAGRVTCRLVGIPEADAERATRVGVRSRAGVLPVHECRTARTGRALGRRDPRLHGRPARPSARRARGRPRVAARDQPRRA